MTIKQVNLFGAICLVLVAAATCFQATQAAPTPLDLCITMAATSISDIAIPSEVIMLERKMWIVNEPYRWKTSLTQLLLSDKKKVRIPHPAGAAKYQKAFDKVILKFIKSTAKRLKSADGGACGDQLALALMPAGDNYQRLVADKHVDLDYIIGLNDLCVRWLAEQITLI